jgi:hypothetical protein
VAFVTIIVLYSVATSLYWWWFRDAEVPATTPREGVLSTGARATRI